MFSTNAGTDVVSAFTNSDLTAYNHIGKPEIVSPVERKIKISGNKIVLNLDAYSVTVARIPLKK